LPLEDRRSLEQESRLTGACGRSDPLQCRRPRQSRRPVRRIRRSMVDPEGTHRTPSRPSTVFPSAARDSRAALSVRCVRGCRLAVSSAKILLRRIGPSAARRTARMRWIISTVGAATRGGWTIRRIRDDTAIGVMATCLPSTQRPWVLD